MKRPTGTDEETTELVLSICHEAANWTGAIRLSAHLIDHEQTPVELASGALDVADLSARIGSLLALVRPLLSGEIARETGVFPAAVLAGLADVLDDHGGRGVHLVVEPCSDLPEVAGNPETLHQLIVTMAYYAIVQASPDGSVEVRAEYSAPESRVTFIVEDSGVEEPDLPNWQTGTLRGRVLACRVACKVLSGLGGSIEVGRAGERTQIALTVPTL
jgi:signal transduction histidine kinase